MHSQTRQREQVRQVEMRHAGGTRGIELNRFVEGLGAGAQAMQEQPVACRVHQGDRGGSMGVGTRDIAGVYSNRAQAAE
jgi:hypothetical protein